MRCSALIEKELAASDLPIRDGVFVAVVGPSGAGKDTLIAYARAALEAEPGAEVDFVRRVITRAADAGSEDHDTLAPEEFEAAESDGAFALAWDAHGLKYGLPAQIDDQMAQGRVVVANVSRTAVPRLKERYANVAVTLITAAPERLAERLAARGRESREQVLARLGRAIAPEAIAGATVIDNSGTPEEAGERLVAFLRRALAWTDVGDAI